MRPHIFVVAALLGACGGGGAHLEASTSGGDKSSTAPSASAKPAPVTSASWSASPSPDPSKATRWAWAAIGCWVGGAWSEALGSLGEERLLATVRRCRLVATEALGAKPEDVEALAAVRGIDPKISERVALAVDEAGKEMPERAHLVSLVRATADAAREAMLARRAAEAVRKAGKDGKSEIDAQTDALVAKDALAKLHGLAAGPLSNAAKTVALMLAADHVEAARGLDPRAKVLTASPAFDVVFGVARPKGEIKPGDWLAYVVAAAKAAGHPPEEGASTHDRELAAFAGVAAGFADRFEAIGKQLEPGEAKEATAGYAKRLRLELAEAAAKAKAKADAKAKTDAAEAEEQKQEAEAAKKGPKKK